MGPRQTSGIYEPDQEPPGGPRASISGEHAPADHDRVVRNPVGESIQTTAEGRSVVVGKNAAVHPRMNGVDEDGSPAPASREDPALDRPRGGEQHRGASVHGVVQEGAARDVHAGVVAEGAGEAEGHGETRGMASVDLRFDDRGRSVA